MPDISTSSQATVSQALTQLGQLASKFEVPRQGVDVLVKHLAGNVLSLNKSTGLLNKVALLSKPDIKGKLAEGQTHQVKLTLENGPSLEFFSQTGAKSASFIPLSEQQLQSLLKLPAQQLISSSLMSKSDTTNKLAAINASVLSVLSKEQLSKLSNTQPATDIIKAKTTSVPNLQNILRISLTDQRPPIEVSLPIKQLNQFTVGEKITLTIAPRGNNWLITILQNKLASQLPPLVPQTANVNATSTGTGATFNSHMRVPKDQQIILSPLLATPIIKASLRGSNPSKPVNLELPIKPVFKQLTKTNREQNQELIQKLQALPIDKLTLQIKPSGDINLLLQNSKPVANIVITKEISQALAPLRLPNQHAIIKLLNLPIDTQKQIQTSHQVSPSGASGASQNSVTENKLRTNVPSVDGNVSPEIRLSMKKAEANLLTAVQEKPFAQSVISPSLLASKVEKTNLVQSLLRVVQAKAETPAITLQSLEKALVDVEFFKGATEESSKQLVERVFQQIKYALPQGKEQDVNHIRQLLTTPALNLSALQMISPTSSQGFMSGLVTLLQMSLSARLTRNQSSRTEHILSILNGVLSGTSKVKPNMTPKAMGELSQLEQKHQLMKEIGRLLSGHQFNKLTNAEQMIQGQEIFYYNLPSAMGGIFKDVELLIKREEEHKEKPSPDEQNNKTWQLTMKLSVGELGELLTKAKLRGDTLDINFYASNETVKNQIMNYLPLLRRKLDSLGIEVSKSQCQLGKIPDTLQQRPHHVFKAKA
jgi:hypothetical protein